jgi:hypothetical protein
MKNCRNIPEEAFFVRPTVSASDAAICDLDNAFAIFVLRVDSGRTQWMQGESSVFTGSS